MTAEQTNPVEQDQTAANENSRPVAKFSGSGGIHVAVWKNKSEQGHTYYAVKPERNYRDDEGEFHSSSYLRDGDILRAVELLKQADQWIEQDKSKFRAAQREDGASR